VGRLGQLAGARSASFEVTRQRGDVVTLTRRDDDGRLLPGEVESLNVSAVYVAGQGWHVTIAARRQFQDWSQAARDTYEQLSTPELVTLIDAELCSELKL